MRRCAWRVAREARRRAAERARGQAPSKPSPAWRWAAAYSQLLEGTRIVALAAREGSTRHSASRARAHHARPLARGRAGGPLRCSDGVAYADEAAAEARPPSSPRQASLPRPPLVRSKSGTVSRSVGSTGQDVDEGLPRRPLQRRLPDGGRGACRDEIEVFDLPSAGSSRRRRCSSRRLGCEGSAQMSRRSRGRPGPSSRSLRPPRRRSPTCRLVERACLANAEAIAACAGWHCGRACSVLDAYLVFEIVCRTTGGGRKGNVCLFLVGCGLTQLPFTRHMAGCRSLRTDGRSACRSPRAGGRGPDRAPRWRGAGRALLPGGIVGSTTLQRAQPTSTAAALLDLAERLGDRRRVAIRRDGRLESRYYRP